MSTRSPGLSHEELAALDLFILRAVQKGVDPKQPMAFIEAIQAVTDHAAQQIFAQACFAVECSLTHIVTQDIAQAAAALDAAGVAAAVGDEGASKIRDLMLKTGEVPDVTLRQLIDIRRKAVDRARGRSAG
jgi:hypothetical protein